MKKERGWVQVGAGLGLFLSFGLILPGCAKVYVECAPSADNDGTPTGRCAVDGKGNCIKRWNCNCP